MARLRLHGFKCLAYAVVLLAIVPCLFEFWLRVAAFKADSSAATDRSIPAVIPDGFTHHQLAPLQATAIKPAASPAASDKVPGAESTTTFRTNSLGIRGAEVRVPKPANVLRIVCLGDETILAASLPDEVTFLAPLKSHLQPYQAREIEILNAAIPDSCLLLAHLQFRHRLLGLQPDIVILHFDPTDLADDERFRRLTDLDASDAPLVSVHPSLQAKPKLKPLCEHFLCINWLNREVIGWLRSHPDDGRLDAAKLRSEWWRDPAFQQTERVSAALRPAAQMAQMAKATGCRVVLAIHPAVEQLLSQASLPSRATDGKPAVGDDRVTPLRIMTELERDSDLTICRITDTLRRVKDPQAALADDKRSLTPFGHEVYAYSLAETLFRAFPQLWTVSNEPASVTPASATQTSGTQTSSAQTNDPR